MPATSPRKPASRKLKKERMRVAASAKKLIQQAMSVSARRELDEHQRMVLIGADRDAFLDAVLNPPEPTDKLIAALRCHRDLMG